MEDPACGAACWWKSRKDVKQPTAEEEADTELACKSEYEEAPRSHVDNRKRRSVRVATFLGMWKALREAASLLRTVFLRAMTFSVGTGIPVDSDCSRRHGSS